MSIQRLFAPSTGPGITGRAERNPQSGVLAVTADVCFYSNVLSAAVSIGWRTECALTVDRAFEIYKTEFMPIVLYDEDLPSIKWDRAFDRLSLLPNHPRLLLAARLIDEDLWRRVLHRRGYDIVEGSANSADLSRALRFAMLSLLVPADN